MIKQLPFTKKNYKGKNLVGGRKAVFSQSRAYCNGYAPTAIPWVWGENHPYRKRGSNG